MEHTIEQIQNDIMNRMQQFDFGDRVTILRELENFCGQQADEALKMEYDMAAMEDEIIDNRKRYEQERMGRSVIT